VSFQAAVNVSRREVVARKIFAEGMSVIEWRRSAPTPSSSQ
jgi:hypothetical protein